MRTPSEPATGAPSHEEGEMVRVGLLDTAIDAGRPELCDGLAAQRFFLLNGLGSEPVVTAGGAAHGTHCAGLILGLSPEPPAPGADARIRIVAGTVLDEGEVLARVLLGLDWLMDCNVSVVCLPLGFRRPTPVLDELLWRMAGADVLVIAPSGNDGAGRVCSPGDHPAVLTVGACDERGGVASFSGSLYDQRAGSCHKPDLLAPGYDVLSAAPGGGWARKAGTSMAAATVAGAAARLRAAMPEASAASIAHLLVSTAEPLSEAGRHRARHGRIRPDLAVASGAPAVPLPPREPTARDAATPFRDPRLMRDLRYLDPTSYATAILEFTDRAAMQACLRDLEPLRCRCHPDRSAAVALGHAPVLILRERAECLNRILAAHEPCIASAADVDRGGFALSVRHPAAFYGDCTDFRIRAAACRAGAPSRSRGRGCWLRACGSPT